MIQCPRALALLVPLSRGIWSLIQENRVDGGSRQGILKLWAGFKALVQRSWPDAHGLGPLRHLIAIRKIHPKKRHF